ncbi:UDP-N-acetylglucosamine 2-epimerase [Candidatus Omnitrophota bacterium]
MSTSRRTIACMTATRADYPRVKSVLAEIAARPHLELKLIVTGIHLLKEFGYTVRQIERDGFTIASRVKMYSGDDSPYGMAQAAARCSAGMAKALKRIDPDILLITVDRVETLATAQTAALMNIPIAHIQGGEVTGTIDESIRHAVTKLSHIHFPATARAAERIVKLGEDPAHVHAVGCPYLDIIRTLEYKDKNDLAFRYGFDPSRPLVLFIQHPVTTEYGRGIDQATITIEALKKISGLEVIALYSNADAGGRQIIAQMRKTAGFHVFPNIDNEDFLSLMKYAQCMVGNSSSAIREAPSFGLAAVNIGTRQQGRLRAGNVIDVDHDIDAIAGAVNKAFSDREFKQGLKKIANPYGDGHAAKRIVDILAAVDLSTGLIQKKLRY